MNKQEAQQKIEELKQYIEQLDKEPKRFKAILNRFYYSIDQLGYTDDIYNQNDKKLEILEDFEYNRKEFDKFGDNYMINWDHGSEMPTIISNPIYQESKYVFTNEKAQELINKYGQYIKLIFE